MATHTIKVTGISEELLGLLDQKIRQHPVGGRSGYIRELIRRDVLEGVREGTAHPTTFRQLLAATHAETERLGESEAELEEFLEAELRAHRNCGEPESHE